MVPRHAGGRGEALALPRQRAQRAGAARPSRAALVGPANAGKSSLFNALGGVALVSASPGTTRDYLTQRLEIDGTLVELIDTAGWRESHEAIEIQAQDLAASQARDADLLLLCVEAGQ